MAIAAGLLRHYVSIQRAAAVLDSNGDEVQNDDGSIARVWEEIAQTWAAIEPISAREFIQSAATQSQITTRITIRYRGDINAADRLVHKGKLYNIHGLLSDK